MIKKILGSIVGIFTLVGVSFGYQFFLVGLDKTPSNRNNNYEIGFLKGGRFLTNYLGTSKNLIALDNQFLMWWDARGKMYLYDNSTYMGLIQGEFQYITSCADFSNSTGDIFSSCGPTQLYSDEIVGNFLKTLVAGDMVYIDHSATRGGCGGYCTFDRYQAYICFSSQSVGSSLCFMGDVSSYYQYPANNPFTGSMNYANTMSFANIDRGLLFTPPLADNNFDGGQGEIITGDVELVEGSIDSYIDYYESRYNWDEGLCYVGTNDFTGAYGKSGVNFEYGSGATIFELYNTMYGSFGSNIISNVGSFINCWSINYTQWFYTVQDERSYKCIYNGPDTNITLDYEDLTFPFRNNRVAIYFMVDNLFDTDRFHNASFSEQSMGEHLAYYCLMKLNYENYKNGSLNFQDLQDKVNPKILDRIDDYNNSRLPNYQGFSVPDMSGNTNIWGNLIQTGSGIPQDLNPTDLFKQFYNKINSLLQNFNPARTVGIIPLWILYPMLFLILFRILRH